MWVKRKDWEELVERVADLERSTGMTSFGDKGDLGHWMRPALPINKVVERIAWHLRLRHRKEQTETWEFGER